VLLRLRPCRFSGPHGAGARARTRRRFAGNDHPEHLVLGDIGHGSRADGLPDLYHHYAVREVKYVMDIVADQKDAAGLFDGGLDGGFIGLPALLLAA